MENIIEKKVSELFSQHFSYLSNIPYRQGHEDQLADGAAWKRLITNLTDKDSVVEKLPLDREKLKMIFDMLGHHYFKGVSRSKELQEELRKAAIHEELLTSLRAYVSEENIIDLFG